MENMSDDCTDRPARTSEAQQAYDEAQERQRRLEVWLEGMLSGGPSLADTVGPWRQALAKSGVLAETPVGDQDKEGLPESNVKSVEELLLNARRRVRESRELTGKTATDITEDERNRRAAQMVEGIQNGRTDDKEPTPLHWVLAARYVEGYINFEDYSIAVLHL
jgi:hypothetical protein